MLFTGLKNGCHKSEGMYILGLANVRIGIWRSAVKHRDGRWHHCWWIWGSVSPQWRLLASFSLTSTCAHDLPCLWSERTIIFPKYQQVTVWLFTAPLSSIIYLHHFSPSSEASISIAYFTSLLSSLPPPTVVLSSSAPLLFSVSPAPKSILSFLCLTFCLLSSPPSSHSFAPFYLGLPLSSSETVSPLLSRMSWICSYTITMGTVTEEIMSESNRKTDGWGGWGGGGGTPALRGLPRLGRTTMRENESEGDKQGR